MAPLTARGAPRARGRVVHFATLLLGALIVAGCSSGTVGTTGKSGTGAQVAPTVAVPAAAVDLQQTIENVIQVVQPSVVEIISTTAQGQAIGSGEILTGDGYLVTNDHVVRGASQFQVRLSNGNKLTAQLTGEAPADDLAVLKVSQSGMRPINIGNSSAVRVGQFVLAIGSPLGLQQSATFGIVSALDRTASEAPNGPAGTLTGLIQTSAPINPGNSGGALVDLQGRLIGIPTLGAADPTTGVGYNGIGFAIPSDRVKFITDQLIKSGHVTSTGQGFIGIVGVTVTPDLATNNNLTVDHGVAITDFASDASGTSPAQRAGLKQGDVIIAVNGVSIDTLQDLAGALQQQGPGAQVTLTIVRGSAQQQVKVTLGERPTSAG
ncbi:MAG TPA: trypsin-like peptidase domain-containing protein [Ktedonobacterales bacterium]|jgi:S1-C subfamily serine protease|nr:trypsin-like peptidase domain-containing protein [Ktedonobacterales bacterium]